MKNKIIIPVNIGVLFIILFFIIKSHNTKPLITILPYKDWSMSKPTLNADGVDTVEQTKYYGPISVTTTHRR